MHKIQSSRLSTTVPIKWIMYKHNDMAYFLLHKLTNLNKRKEHNPQKVILHHSDSPSSVLYRVARYAPFYSMVISLTKIEIQGMTENDLTSTLYSKYRINARVKRNSTLLFWAWNFANWLLKINLDAVHPENNWKDTLVYN